MTEGWQPIETAPRDGTLVDLWVRLPDGSAIRLADCYWGRDQRGKRGKCWHAPYMDYQAEYGPVPRNHAITHWRPLPAPPEASE